jgi:hypothetical protein
MTIAIDFDGTCVTHEFPVVGSDIGAAPVLRDLVKEGHRLILYTMRSDYKGGSYLQDAKDWFKKNGIDLYASQVNPQQKHWTSSPKCYAELYIDDAALGIPLTHHVDTAARTRLDKPYVDWEKVRALLVAKGVL